MARKSLRERNQAAIALDPDDHPKNPLPAPAPAPAPAQAQAQAQEVVQAAPEPIEPAPTPAARQRLSHPKPQRRPRLELHGAGCTSPRWSSPTPKPLPDGLAARGVADTFGRWIAQAIDTYANRTPEQRAATAQPRGRAQERTGATRSFSIPTATVEAMRAAITADHQASRWPSDSAWRGEAIAAAVDTTRTQNDGTLPTPPARLPNRLIR